MLVTLICKQCGVEYTPQSKPISISKYCSNRCRWDSQKGKPNVNRKDRSNYSCFVCGTTKTHLDKDRYNNPKWYHQHDINTGELIGVVCAVCYIRLNRGYRLGYWRKQRTCSICGTHNPGAQGQWRLAPNKWDVLCMSCFWHTDIKLKKVRKGPYKPPKLPDNKQCIICGKKFRVYPKQISKIKCCSKKCRALAAKGRKMPAWFSEFMRKRRLTMVFPKVDTKLEKRLQDALRARGIEFVTHKPIYGQPDIFIEPNICIFADGNYWHANPAHYPPDQIISKQHRWTSREVWERDKRVTVTLQLMGMQVLRFWEDDINKRLDWCISEIHKVIPVSSLVISK